jgi:ATP-dependent helicase/nuclease subunit A
VPARLAFVANDRQPPPSLQALAAQEDAAQAREELNALYVAMTRARQRLVASGVVPHRAPASSWWQRLEPVATPLPAPDAPAAATAPSSGFDMLEVPSAGIQQALAAIQSEATDEPERSAPPTPRASARPCTGCWSTPATRPMAGVPSAPPRPSAALPWRPSRPATRRPWRAASSPARPPGPGPPARCWRLSTKSNSCTRASACASTAWCAAAPAPRPRGLVGAGLQSAAHPERNEALQAQLARYRAAVERLHPGQAVRVAFLSGKGRVVDA